MNTLFFLSVSNASEEQQSYKVLSEDEMPKPGTLVSIDAEFVALSQEETEIRSDGTKSLIRPSRLSLARVSVLRGESGDMEGIPFIDDYIANSEPIVDYLTEYSGIEGTCLQFQDHFFSMDLYLIFSSQLVIWTHRLQSIRLCLSRLRTRNFAFLLTLAVFSLATV